MKAIRQHPLFIWFWYLTTLHIINMSVDAGVFGYYIGQTDEVFNEMESITELVAEQLLDIEDCFEEHPEPNESDHHELFGKKQISFFTHLLATLPAFNVDLTDGTRPTGYRRFRAQHSPHILSPPPWRVA